MRGVDFLEGGVASCGPAVNLWVVVNEAGRVKAEGGEDVEGRGRDESMISEQVSGRGVGGGGAGETGRGGRLLVGGRRQGPC